MCSPTPDGSRLSVARHNRGIMTRGRHAIADAPVESGAADGTVERRTRLARFLATARHGPSLDQAPVGRQRLPDDLIHVVVAVGGEPAHEADVRLGQGQGFVALVERLIFGPGDRIIRVSLLARDLVGDAGPFAHLPGEVLVFGDPRVGHGSAG